MKKTSKRVRLSGLSIGGAIASAAVSMVGVMLINALAQPPNKTAITDGVYEQTLNILLSHASGWQMQTTQARVDEISIDITFPQGLVQFGTDGSRKFCSVAFDLQYAPRGTSNWSILSSDTFVPQQDSPSMPAPTQVYTTYGGQIVYSTRYDIVALNVFTGAAVVFQGTPGVPGDQVVDYWGGDYAGSYINYFEEPVEPIIPSWAASVARVVRRRGDRTIVSGDITDRRDSRLGKEHTGDFLPSAHSPENTTIGIASGYLRKYVGTTARTDSVLRISERWPVANGQYHVRIRRTGADTSDSLIYDDAYWTSLRSITTSAP